MVVTNKITIKFSFRFNKFQINLLIDKLTFFFWKSKPVVTLHHPIANTLLQQPDYQCKLFIYKVKPLYFFK